MQRLLFDLDAIGLAAAGAIALVTRWKPSAWWLPLQAPLGLALLGLGLVVGASMVPELASNDEGVGAVLMGIKATLAVVSIALGGLFGLQLIARIAKRETVAVLAQIAAPYQLTLGLIAIVAPIAYWLYRMHWLNWLQLS
jgi:hypothetical protein